MTANTYERSARLHYLARRQAEIREQVQDALPPVKIGQLCYVWHDRQYKLGRVVRLSLSKLHPGTWNIRIYPFEHRGKHMPVWQVCQPADMVRTEPPEWECVECGREWYQHEMAETDICAECAQGIDYPEIEASDSVAVFWADWYEDEIKGGW